MTVLFATRSVLSPDEVAKRRVYAQFIGLPLDPAYLLSDPWIERDGMTRDLVERIKSRRVPCKDPWTQWPELVTHPELGGPETLAIALTLTRMCVATPPKKIDPGAIAWAHEQVWMRLRPSAPPA